jgi:tetratricopeptide (TPR) repeat protein
VDGAERFATDAYKRWQKVSPQNPFPWVAEARAAIAAADKAQLLSEQQNTPADRRRELQSDRGQWLKAAEDALARAIELKQDYADAHFLLAQTFDRQGKLDEAIKKAEESRQFNPFSVGIAFQLGFLYYKGEHFADPSRSSAER